MATRKSIPNPIQRASKTKAAKVAPEKKAPEKLNEKPADSHPVKDAGLALVASVKKKIKLVRDSFTIPKDEYVTLSDLKLRSARLDREAKKSEVLRAGIEALSKMSEAMFSAALDAISSLKTGRPKHSKKTGSKKTTKNATKNATEKTTKKTTKKT